MPQVFFQRDDGSGVSLDPAASSIFTALNEEKDDDVAASVAAAAAELVDAVGEKVVDVRAGTCVRVFLSTVSFICICQPAASREN